MLFVQILALAIGASALSVTAPTEGSSISQSGDLTITWSAVSTDTQSFDIHLALATDSGNSQTIKTSVSSSSNSYKTSASAFSPGNYTINLVGNTKESSGILAQSKWFLITAGTASSPTSTSSTLASSSLVSSASATPGTNSSSAVPSSVVSQALPASSAIMTYPAADSANGTIASPTGLTSSTASGTSGTANKTGNATISSSSNAATASSSKASSGAITLSTFSLAGLFVAGFAMLMI